MSIELENTCYSYNAMPLFPDAEQLDDPGDFFNEYYGALFALLGDDANVDAVRTFLHADPHKHKWVTSDYMPARCIDILLTMAAAGTATALVREFGANPGQVDASNGMSAVEYAEEKGDAALQAHLMGLANEFEEKNHWFANK